MNVSKKGPDPLGSLSHQAGAMARPFGAMENTVVPPSAAPDGPATPPSGPPTTVIRPPVGTAWRVRSDGSRPVAAGAVRVAAGRSGRRKNSCVHVSASHVPHPCRNQMSCNICFFIAWSQLGDNRLIWLSTQQRC